MNHLDSKEPMPMAILYLFFIVVFIYQVFLLSKGMYVEGLSYVFDISFRRWIMLAGIPLFIFSYINKKMDAWYIALVIGTFLLFYLILEDNSDNIYPPYYYTIFNAFLLMVFIGYMLSRYKNYKSYIGIKDTIEYNKTKNKPTELNDCINPLFQAYNVAKTLLVLNILSLFNALNNYDQILPLLAALLFNIIFIIFYKKRSPVACDLAIIFTILSMIYLLIYTPVKADLILFVIIKTIALIPGSVAIMYLLRRREEYASYVSKK